MTYDSFQIRGKDGILMVVDSEYAKEFPTWEVIKEFPIDKYGSPMSAHDAAMGYYRRIKDAYYKFFDSNNTASKKVV